MVRLGLGIFIIAFGVLFYLGFQKGHEFANGANSLEEAAFSRVQVEQDGDILLLTYRHDGKLLYAFNVDSNKLIAGDTEVFRRRSALGATSAVNYIFADPSVPKMFGGATLGYTVKDLITHSGALLKTLVQGNTRIKIIGFAVAGAASGYSAGYWFAIHYSVPTPDAPEILSLLNDEKKWAHEEWTIYAALVERLGYAISHLEAEKQRQDYSSLLRAATVGAVGRYNDKLGLSSADFGKLVALQRLLGNDHIQQVAETTSLAGGISKWFGLAMGAIVITIAAALIWMWTRERKASRITPETFPK